MCYQCGQPACGCHMTSAGKRSFGQFSNRERETIQEAADIVESLVLLKQTKGTHLSLLRFYSAL